MFSWSSYHVPVSENVCAESQKVFSQIQAMEGQLIIFMPATFQSKEIEGHQIIYK